ncbi:hypothetical protein [Candidatus Coxiella mudrowiae]|nr:hypothetical protein [Candidatus Coxiella mudrowiae]
MINLITQELQIHKEIDKHATDEENLLFPEVAEKNKRALTKDA